MDRYMKDSKYKNKTKNSKALQDWTNDSDVTVTDFRNRLAVA